MNHTCVYVRVRACVFVRARALTNHTCPELARGEAKGAEVFQAGDPPRLEHHCDPHHLAVALVRHRKGDERVDAWVLQQNVLDVERTELLACMGV